MIRRRTLLRSVSASVALAGGTATLLPALPSARADADKAPMQVLKPRRLEPGMTVGLVAPSSPTQENETVRFAIDVVRSLGFRVKEGKHLFDRTQYLAGTDRDRAADVTAMFADPEVDAIFALRGGYGSARMLPYIDYERVRANPKVFIGYSDITGILSALYARSGLVCFHGPVAEGNFSEYTLAEFKQVLFHPAPRTRIAAPPPFEGGEGRAERDNRLTRFVGGKATGPLVGGNLSVLCGLIGSPYEPDFRNAIVFLEDVHEAPYRIDRLLTHLVLSGRLTQASGIALGKFTDTDDEGNTFSVEEVIEQVLVPLGVPLLRGLMIGHVQDKSTVPLGIQAELDADAGSLTLLEPAVS